MAAVGENQSGPARKMRNAACQTPVNAYVIESLIRTYWNELDRKGIDQIDEPMQFIVNSSSSMRGCGSHLDNEDDLSLYTLEDYEAYIEYMKYMEEEEEEEKAKETKKMDKEAGEERTSDDELGNHNEKAKESAVCDLEALD